MHSTISAEQLLYKELGKNIHSLVFARKSIKRQINLSLRNEDLHSVDIYTKMYALIYFTWTEANLLKLINTPHSFKENDKTRILVKQDIIEKWTCAIDIAFSKFRRKGSDIPNKRKAINKLIGTYLKNQAIIRNKIAHGQWVIPLYKKKSLINPDAKSLIDNLDIVQIDLWFDIAFEFIEIIKGLIEAKIRNNFKAHYNHYFTRMQSIENLIQERKSWTLESKKRKLQLKPIQ